MRPFLPSDNFPMWESESEEFDFDPTLWESPAEWEEREANQAGLWVWMFDNIPPYDADKALSIQEQETLKGF